MPLAALDIDLVKPLTFEAQTIKVQDIMVGTRGEVGRDKKPYRRLYVVQVLTRYSDDELLVKYQEQGDRMDEFSGSLAILYACFLVHPENVVVSFSIHSRSHSVIQQILSLTHKHSCT